MWRAGLVAVLLAPPAAVRGECKSDEDCAGKRICWGYSQLTPRYLPWETHTVGRRYETDKRAAGQTVLDPTVNGAITADVADDEDHIVYAQGNSLYVHDRNQPTTAAVRVYQHISLVDQPVNIKWVKVGPAWGDSPSTLVVVWDANNHVSFVMLEWGDAVSAERKTEMGVVALASLYIKRTGLSAYVITYWQTAVAGPKHVQLTIAQGEWQKQAIVVNGGIVYTPSANYKYASTDSCIARVKPAGGSTVQVRCGAAWADVQGGGTGGVLRGIVMTVAGGTETWLAVVAGTWLTQVRWDTAQNVEQYRTKAREYFTGDANNRVVHAVGIAARGQGVMTVDSSFGVRFHRRRRVCMPTHTYGPAADAYIQAAQQDLAVGNAEPLLADDLATLDAWVAKWWQNSYITASCRVPGDSLPTFRGHLLKDGVSVLHPYRRALANRDDMKQILYHSKVGTEDTRANNGATDPAEIKTAYLSTDIPKLAAYARNVLAGFDAACLPDVLSSLKGVAKSLRVETMANRFGIPKVRNVDLQAVPNNIITKQGNIYTLHDFKLRLILGDPVASTEADLSLITDQLSNTGAVNQGTYLYKGIVANNKVKTALKAVTTWVRKAVLADQRAKCLANRLRLNLNPSFKIAYSIDTGKDTVKATGSITKLLMGAINGMGAVWASQLFTVAELNECMGIANNKQKGLLVKAIDAGIDALQANDVDNVLDSAVSHYTYMMRGRKSALVPKMIGSQVSKAQWLFRAREDHHIEDGCIAKDANLWKGDNNVDYGDHVVRLRQTAEGEYFRENTRADAAHSTANDAKVQLRDMLHSMLCGDRRPVINPFLNFGRDVDVAWDLRGNNNARQAFQRLVKQEIEKGGWKNIYNYRNMHKAKANFKLVYSGTKPPLQIYQSGPLGPKVTELQNNARYWEGLQPAVVYNVPLTRRFGSLTPAVKGDRANTIDFMKASAKWVAIRCRANNQDVVDDSWEWLHRIANAIGGKDMDVPRNMVLGRKHANTEMITYEWMYDKVKAWVSQENPGEAVGTGVDLVRDAIYTAQKTHYQRSLKHHPSELEVEVKTRVSPNNPANSLSKKLRYTMQARRGTDTTVVMSSVVDLRRRSQPAELTNLLAWLAVDTYTPADAQVGAFNVFPFAARGHEATLGRDAALLADADVLTDGGAAAAALGLGSVAAWGDLAEDSAAGLRLKALQAEHFKAASQTGGVLKQGTTVLVVRGVNASFDVSAMLFVRVGGAVDYVVELVPSEGVAAVAVFGGGAQLQTALGGVLPAETGVRLVQVQYDGQQSEVAVLCTVNVSSVFAFLPTALPGVQALDVRGTQRGQHVLGTYSFEAGVSDVAGSVTLSQDYTVVSAPVKVVMPASQAVQMTGTVWSDFDQESGTATAKVGGSLKAMAELSWGGTEKVTVEVGGGQTASDVATLYAGIADWDRPFGADFLVDHVGVEISMGGAGTAVAVSARVVVRNGMAVTLEGTYSAADGLSVSGALLNEGSGVLTLDDVDALHSRTGSETVLVKGGVPAFTVVNASFALRTQGPSAGLSVGGTVEIFGATVAMEAAFSKTDGVSFSGKAAGLAVGEVVFREADLSFAFGGSQTYAQARAEVVAPFGVVVLEGGFQEQNGTEYYLRGSFVAEGLGGVSLADATDGLLLAFRLMTGHAVPVPADYPHFFSSVVLQSLQVSLASENAVVPDTWVQGRGFAADVQAQLGAAGLSLWLSVSSDRFVIGGSAKNFTLGAYVTVAELDLELAVVAGSPESTQVSASTTLVVAGQATVKLMGLYDTAGFCLLGAFGSGLSLGEVLRFHKDQTGRASAMPVPAKLPSAFTVTSVQVTVCDSAVPVQGSGTTRPAGLVVSGAVTLFGAPVAVHMLLSADRVEFSGKISGVSVGAYAATGELKFEVACAAATCNDARVVFEVEVSNGLKMDVTLAEEDGGKKTIAVAYTGAAVGLDTILEFVEKLLGVPGTLPVEGLAHIRVQSFSAKADTDGVFAFTVDLDFFGAVGVTADLKIDTAHSSVGVTFAGKPEDSMTLGGLLGAAGAAHQADLQGQVEKHTRADQGLAGFTFTLTADKAGMSVAVSGHAGSFDAGQSGSEFAKAMARIGNPTLAASLSVPFGPGATSFTFAILEGPTRLGAKGNAWLESSTDATAGLQLSVTVTAGSQVDPALKMQASVPLKVCKAKCGADEPSAKEWIWFTGELDVSNEELDGKIRMTGGWYEVFQQPHIHLLSAQVDVEMKLASPAELDVVIGGHVCIGAKADCVPAAPAVRKRDYTLDIFAYVGINVADPLQSWFFVMSNGASLLQVFRAVGHESTALKLPAAVQTSGVRPTKDCAIANHTAPPAGVVDQECYVVLSVSPSKQEVDTDAGVVQVVAGFAARGIIKIGGFEILIVAVMQLKPQPFVFVDVELSSPQRIVIGSTELISFGQSLVPDKTDVAGGAKFKLRVGADPDAGYKEVFEMQVKGAIVVPKLGSYGAVDLDISDAGFHFDAQVSLFKGAFEAVVQADWDWDGSDITIHLEGVRFLGGVVAIDDFLFHHSSTETVISAAVSVLGFVHASATLEYTAPAAIRFDLEASLLLDVRCWGEAQIATPFSHSHFAIHVKVSLYVKKVAKAVWNGVKAVGKAIGKVWRKVAHGVAKLRDAVKRGLTKAWHTLEKLADGSPVLDFLVKAGKKLFERAKELGRKLKQGWAKFMKGLGHVFGFLLREKDSHYEVRGQNDFGCNRLVRRYKKCTFTFFCKWKEDPATEDPECMKQVAQAANEAEDMMAAADTKATVVAASQAGNAGLHHISQQGKAYDASSGYEQAAACGDNEYVVPESHTRGTVHMPVSCTGPQLGDGAHLWKASQASVSAQTSINFGTEDHDRAVQAVGQRLQDHALQTQAGVTDELAKVAGRTAETRKPVLGFRNGEQDWEVGCEAARAVPFPEPHFVVTDAQCKTPKPVAAVVDETQTPLACGATRVIRRFVGTDGCGKHSHKVVQRVTVRAPTLEFAHFPPDCNIGECTVDPIEGRGAHGRARVDSCGNEVHVTYSDTEHVRMGTCTQWQRLWTATMALPGCAPATYSRVQKVAVCDAGVSGPVHLVEPVWTNGARLRLGYDPLTASVRMTSGSAGQSVSWSQTNVTHNKMVFRNTDHNCYLDYSVQCFRPGQVGGCRVANCTSHPRVWLAVRSDTLGVGHYLQAAPGEYLYTGAHTETFGNALTQPWFAGIDGHASQGGQPADAKYVILVEQKGLPWKYDTPAMAFPGSSETLSTCEDVTYGTPHWDHLDSRCVDDTAAPSLVSTEAVVSCTEKRTTRTWSGEDACGNAAASVQHVTVVPLVAAFDYVPADGVYASGTDIGPEKLVGGMARARQSSCWDVQVTHADAAGVAVGACTVVVRTWTARLVQSVECGGGVSTTAAQKITLCGAAAYGTSAILFTANDGGGEETFARSAGVASAPAAYQQYVHPMPEEHAQISPGVGPQDAIFYWTRISVGTSHMHLYDAERQCFLGWEAGLGAEPRLACTHTGGAGRWVYAGGHLSVVAGDAGQLYLFCTTQLACSLSQQAQTVFAVEAQPTLTYDAAADLECPAYAALYAAEDRAHLSAGSTALAKPVFAAHAGCTAVVALKRYAVSEADGCGVRRVTLVWQGAETFPEGQQVVIGGVPVDNCRRYTAEAVQTITVRPAAPVFRSFAPMHVAVVQTQGSTYDWRNLDVPGGEPTLVRAGCRLAAPDVAVRHVDSELTDGSSTAYCMQFRRTWTVQLAHKAAGQCDAAVFGEQLEQEVVVCSHAASAKVALSVGTLAVVADTVNAHGVRRLVTAGPVGVGEWTEHRTEQNQSLLYNPVKRCYLNLGEYCEGYSSTDGACVAPFVVAVCAESPRVWERVKVADGQQDTFYLTTGRQHVALHTGVQGMLRAGPVSDTAAVFVVQAAGESTDVLYPAKQAVCSDDADCSSGGFCRPDYAHAEEEASAGVVVGSTVCSGAALLRVGDSCVRHEGCCTAGAVCVATAGHAVCQPAAGRCADFIAAGGVCAGKPNCCAHGTLCLQGTCTPSSLDVARPCTAVKSHCVKRSPLGGTCGGYSDCSMQKCEEGLECVLAVSPYGVCSTPADTPPPSPSPSPSPLPSPPSLPAAAAQPVDYSATHKQVFLLSPAAQGFALAYDWTLDMVVLQPQSVEGGLWVWHEGSTPYTVQLYNAAHDCYLGWRNQCMGSNPAYCEVATCVASPVEWSMHALSSRHGQSGTVRLTRQTDGASLFADAAPAAFPGTPTAVRFAAVMQANRDHTLLLEVHTDPLPPIEAPCYNPQTAAQFTAAGTFASGPITFGGEVVLKARVQIDTPTPHARVLDFGGTGAAVSGREDNSLVVGLDSSASHLVVEVWRGTRADAGTAMAAVDTRAVPVGAAFELEVRITAQAGGGFGGAAGTVVLLLDGVAGAAMPLHLPAYATRTWNKIGASNWPSHTDLDGAVSNFQMQYCTAAPTCGSASPVQRGVAASARVACGTRLFSTHDDAVRQEIENGFVATFSVPEGTRLASLRAINTANCANPNALSPAYLVLMEFTVFSCDGQDLLPPDTALLGPVWEALMAARGYGTAGEFYKIAGQLPWDQMAKRARMSLDACPHTDTPQGVSVVRQSAAVRCCSTDGKVCQDAFFGMTLLPSHTADQFCDSINLRVCSTAELASGVCCGVPNPDEDSLAPVWSSESVAALTADSCPTSGGVVPTGAWRTRAAVLCCSADGAACGVPASCTEADQTYDEAVVACAGVGKRLCTEAEVATGMCCGSACGHGGVAIWVAAQPIGTTANGFPFASVGGCPAVQNMPKSFAASSTDAAAVRCCLGAAPNKSCITQLDGGCHAQSTYAEAETLCAGVGGRLCTEGELGSGLCCDTGCGFDLFHVWAHASMA